MSSALSLISLNIEHEKHLDLVLPFLVSRKPDVVCVQELLEFQIPQLEDALGAKSFYVPMHLWSTSQGLAPMGVGIFSRLPTRESMAYQYAGQTGTVVEISSADAGTKFATQKFMIALSRVEKEGQLFSIGTTHFPWTPDSYADDYQRKSVQALLQTVDAIGQMVLCGDFNAPRGQEIFSAIASKLKDNVPLTYTTSIDGNIHRAGPLPNMVDGLFSTPEYRLSNVEMVCGVSDHCALSARIEKTA